MAWPDDYLTPGETVQHERQHPKTLIAPAVALVVVVVLAIIAAGYVTAIPSRGIAGLSIPWRTIAELVILIVAVLLILGLTVRPCIGWLTTHFVLTSDRITTAAAC